MRIVIGAWRRPREGEEYCKVTRVAFTNVAADPAHKSRPLPMED
jgi:acyl-CoA hydrolase